MPLSELYHRVVDEIHEALGHRLSDEEKEKVGAILRQALADATDHAHEEFNRAALLCCGPDADKAHKIAEETARRREALVANLMAMR